MDQIIGQVQRYMESYGCDLLFAANAENILYLSDMEMTASSCNPVLFAVQPLSPTVVLVPSSGNRVIFTASALKQYIDDKGIHADVYYYPSNLFLRFDDGIVQPEIYAPTLEDCIRQYLIDFCPSDCHIFGDSAFCILCTKSGILSKGLSSAEELLTACKVRKVPEELRRLRIASRVSYAAMERVEQLVSGGGLLREIDLFYAMRDIIYCERCQWNYTSLSAGPYSPDIYHTPMDYLLQDGDIVRMDVGAVWKGYGSDVARSCCYGTARKADERLYQTLCEAQKRMVEAARPGTDIARLFEIGDSYIKAHGYPEYRRAGLGHSIGVLTEEQPFISPRNVGFLLEENMVFSIETPYYIKDKAGFNVEDIVLITRDGNEILS